MEKTTRDLSRVFPCYIELIFFLGIPIWKMVQETSLSRDYIEKLTHDLFCIEIGEDENLHLFRHVSEIIHESKGGKLWAESCISEY